MRLAILLTCHNRIEKTKRCLQNLEASIADCKKITSHKIYLTDDGSNDGTGQWVLENIKNATVLKGDGTLFWAKGMFNSWNEAIRSNYDYYLLLNDDTELVEKSMKILFEADEYIEKEHSKPGLSIGGTKGKDGNLSYSGSIITNKFLYTQKRLIPNGEYQQAEIANANIMLVPQKVVESIGIISSDYAHGMADYDYSYRAHKNGVPVVICPKYCGLCDYDHEHPYENFWNLKLKERIKVLKSPLGLDFLSHATFVKKFFPYRLPFVYFFAWFKVLFPRTYYYTLRLRGWK